MSIACPFRHFVDLLRFLGSLRGDPELVGFVKVEDVISWVGIQVNALTGNSQVDILQTIVRLTREESLDGIPPGSAVEWYAGGPRRDLNHVAARLHELDQEGTTPRIWRKVCRKWPIFGKAHRAAIGSKGEPTQAGPQRSKPARRMTRKEANNKAMTLAAANPQFVHKTQREWADAIGCSSGLISDLPLWREVAARTGRARKGKSPPVVRLTEKLLAVTPDATLKRLTAEQREDFEASPLEAEPPGHRRKRKKTRKL